MSGYPMIPTNYFLTFGAGESDASSLNAFDRALARASIAQCNLVPVSSIIPAKAKEVSPVAIEPGTVTFVVLAKASGTRGDTISAAVGYLRPQGGRHGIVAEGSSKHPRSHTEADVRRALAEMSATRGLDCSGARIVGEELEIRKRHGSAVAALVFVP